MSSPRWLRRSRRAQSEDERRHRQLCRQSQHQLHQHLRLPVPVLRLRERQGESERTCAASPELPLEEIQRRVREAWERGATEVCMQGGIHPSYTGATYLDICRAAKAVVPAMHVHAFSPLEVWQGARTLGISLAEFLGELKRAGLGSLPGTAAEILDDEVRAVLCSDKIKTGEWLEVMKTAHKSGLRSTATIMFGHMEALAHWARHLLRLRALQAETGGFTEFVPCPSCGSAYHRKGRRPSDVRRPCSCRCISLHAHTEHSSGEDKARGVRLRGRQRSANARTSRFARGRCGSRTDRRWRPVEELIRSAGCTSASARRLRTASAISLGRRSQRQTRRVDAGAALNHRAIRRRFHDVGGFRRAPSTPRCAVDSTIAAAAPQAARGTSSSFSRAGPHSR